MERKTWEKPVSGSVAHTIIKSQYHRKFSWTQICDTIKHDFDLSNQAAFLLLTK